MVGVDGAGRNRTLNRTGATTLSKGPAVREEIGRFPERRVRVAWVPRKRRGPMTDTDTKVREAVGVFQDEKSLLSAVDGLLIAGVDRSHLSLLAGQKTVEAKLGHRFEKVAELEDEPEAPTQVFVSVDSRTE